MSKEIYISSTPHETRLAIVEKEELSEIYYERENEYTLAGSIYNGKVTRVLPGMQSSFVDIGLERDAFLYITDFLEEQVPEEVAIVSSLAVNLSPSTLTEIFIAIGIRLRGLPQAGLGLRAEPHDRRHVRKMHQIQNAVQLPAGYVQAASHLSHVADVEDVRGSRATSPLRLRPPVLRIPSVWVSAGFALAFLADGGTASAPRFEMWRRAGRRVSWRPQVYRRG